ncbi:AraC family transcriptional regulator [Fimbriiglobus ruber]|uniref:Transcriptional regulator, AraC family n=1 Tax=Fimbriiglobus ruber TaxID=1908690 RepID=A0A225DWL6_9BACT|nr:AraC family transcriptional regulator [Fimbriiglobus ruber]OWK45403.1 Transcriptional regulator, AraC family [Fimbriiglobus ruber]
MDPVRKALWYVESHSREPVALEDVARACHVSAFHLTRAFAAATGLSLMRYVRARRLSEAARRLADGADDILALALEAGYGSHEAFTRAFRDQFGATPEQVRARGHLDNIPIVEALPMSTATTPAPDLAPPRFETRKPTLFAGLVERHSCQSPVGIPDQWQRFTPYLGNIPGQVGRVAYGVCYNFDRDGNFDYLCAVEVTNDANLPKGLTSLAMPEQRYAVFTHAGHVAGIRATLAAIWNQWFPESGYKAAEAPTLERYGPEFNPQTGLGGFEIWVSIQS